MQALIDRFRRIAKPRPTDRFDWRLRRLALRVPAHLPDAGTTGFRRTA